MSDGILRTKDHAYWDHGAGPLPGVTTVTKMYDKSDVLVGWAKKETARFALSALDTLVTHREHASPVPECAPCATEMARRKKVGLPESARMWVSSIPDLMRDAAADLGTRVHAVAESMGRGEHFAASQDPTVIPFAEQYLRFQETYRPEYLAIEYVGVNRDLGYGGTGDIVAVIHEQNDPDDWPRPTVWLLDIKTHTKDTPLPSTYYPETGMQLAACAAFTHVARRTRDLPNEELLGEDVVPARDVFPSPDRYGVLLLGREDYRLIPYAVTDETLGAFASCLRLHKWKWGEAQKIVGAA